jgi:hypothetical protein
MIVDQVAHDANTADTMFKKAMEEAEGAQQRTDRLVRLFKIDEHADHGRGESDVILKMATDIAMIRGEAQGHRDYVERQLGRVIELGRLMDGAPEKIEALTARIDGIEHRIASGMGPTIELPGIEQARAEVEAYRQRVEDWRKRTDEQLAQVNATLDATKRAMQDAGKTAAQLAASAFRDVNGAATAQAEATIEQRGKTFLDAVAALRYHLDIGPGEEALTRMPFVRRAGWADGGWRLAPDDNAFVSVYIADPTGKRVSQLNGADMLATDWIITKE